MKEKIPDELANELDALRKKLDIFGDGDRFKTLFESLNDAIFLLDLKGNFIDINRTAYERLGYTKEEMLAIHISELDPPEFGALVPERFKQITKHGKAMFESAHKRKDGTIMPVEVNARIVEFGGEKLILSVIRDITERKEVEEVLQESEEKYRNLVDEINDGFYILDEKGYVVFANRALVKIHGFDAPEDIIGKSFVELAIPEVRDEILKNFEIGMTTGKSPGCIEFPAIKKGGGTAFIEVKPSPVIKDGRLIGTSGVVRDITERKKAEEELKESEARFRGAFENAAAGASIVDLKGRFLRANQRLCDLLGYREEELLSRTFSDVTHPDDIQVGLDNLKRQLAGEADYTSFEKRCLHKDGHVIHVNISPALIRDESGDPQYFVAMWQDITESKEIENVIKRAREELEERVEERTRELILLQNINAAMNMGMSLEDLMNITVEGVKDTFDYTACDIFLLDEERKNLILSAISTDSKILKKIEKLIGHKAVGFKIPLFEGSHFTKMIREKKPHISEDVVRVFEDFAQDKRLRKLAGSVAKIAGFKSAMEVPLIAEEEVIGAIGVSSRESITPEDAERIRRFASQIALTIKKAKLEKALKESEEKHRSIIDNIIDVYYRGNLEGKLVMASPSAARLFGYASVEEMIGMDIAEDFYYNPRDREPLINELKKHGKAMNYELLLKRKDGSVFPVETTTYFVYDERGKPVAVEGIFRDVTDRKRAEEEMKRRLMKYSLDDGNVYLAKEPSTDLSLRAFNDLLNVGYDGLIISRDPEEKFEKIADSGFEFLWLAEKGGKKASSPALKEIKKAVKNLQKKNAVLIDRLDYLISKNSFKKTLSFIQDLREAAYLSGFIAILSIDPSTIEKRELRLLEKETREIELHSKTRLPEDLLEILRFTYEQNATGIKPSYSDIGKEVGASKPTVRKRIKNLIFKGYMVESKKGLYKVVELTDRGRNMFF